MYHVLYFMMLIGFLGVSLYSQNIKMLLIGILLTIVNAILFWR
jgi:hypothetical protein